MHSKMRPVCGAKSGAFLPPKADIRLCGWNIRFEPEADIAPLKSAAKRMPLGIVTPSALAVLRLTTNSNFVGFQPVEVCVYRRPATII
jgi:hypothetical protein